MTDFNIKFVSNSRNKKEQIKLVDFYNNLIQSKTDEILKKCYDFSQISDSRKRELIFLTRTYCNSDLIRPDFTLENLFALFNIIKKTYFVDSKNNIKMETYDLYLYNTTQVRELLFLYNRNKKSINYHFQKKLNKKIDDVFEIEVYPIFEKINLVHSFYTEKNLPEVISKLALESIKISLRNVK